MMPSTFDAAKVCRPLLSVSWRDPSPGAPAWVGSGASSREGAARAAARAVVGVAGERAAAAAAARAATRAVGARVAARGWRGQW